MSPPASAGAVANGADPATLARHFAAARESMISDLRALVERESPSADPARVSSLAAWIVSELARRGVPARTIPCLPHGDSVLAGAACDAMATRLGVLLLGHIDTVWPVGSLREMPFRIDQAGRATGPGVFDMKAGIATAMSVLAALPRTTPVSALFVSDEEIGTTACRPLLREVALRHRAVLVLEPSLRGAVKIARKGVGTFDVAFEGRAAHAGLDPERGASSLLELARFSLYADSLADAAQGTTVTPTVAHAGTTINVVPESARLVVDARVWTAAEAERVEARLRGYAPHDSRVRVTIGGTFDRPPLEGNEGTRSLYRQAAALAAALGFDLPEARVGGASDGNLTAAAGVPTLDGLGPKGDGAHARDEFVEIDDLPVRAALVAALAAQTT